VRQRERGVAISVGVANASDESRWIQSLRSANEGRLIIPKPEYLIVAIFGMEYAMNMGEPETETYKEWLRNNTDRSPLYPKGPHNVEQ
jgi:hypothetical protein